jgi:hypothetical protein
MPDDSPRATPEATPAGPPMLRAAVEEARSALAGRPGERSAAGRQDGQAPAADATGQSIALAAAVLTASAAAVTPPAAHDPSAAVTPTALQG